MIGPDDERVHPPAGAAFGESVTFAWGDLGRDLYGSSRLGLGADGTASALALLFADGRPAAVGAAGGEAIATPTWERLAAGGVTVTVEEPLRAWTATFAAAEGGFDLRFEALSAPAELGTGAVAASAAGLHGYEQLCRVAGTVRCGEQRTQIDCLGQRGHQWGAPDWERIALARTVSAWFDDGSGVTLASVRPDDATAHAHEAVSAWLLDPHGVVPIAEPLLSTTLDGDGRQRRASLELWEDGEERSYPHRAAGEAVCGTTLDLGRLRLDTAFFTWRMEGRNGVGRYDVLRRVEG
jgi:hypothetical protein